MKHNHITHENCIVLLMGIAGAGKRTVGEALSKMTHFKFVPCDSWMDPILYLLGNDASIMWALDEKGWHKLNDARDVIFSTIADVCPKTSNFIITFEMLDKDPYHQIFYDKVVEIVEKRQAIFVPVRLICDENELVNRVVAEDRKKHFKTGDVNLVRKRVREQSVFYSNHSNELTINNTNKTPQQVVKLIVEHLDQINRVI